jgi:hypothetical protein
MGIDFRRYDTRVAEESLNYSQVGAIFQHVSCRAVPEGMRIDSFFEAGQSDLLVDGPRDGARKDSTIPH